MSQIARYAERQFVGAWVDQEQREQLAELARQQDRSVSSLIRRALDRELQHAAQLEDAAAARLHHRSASSTFTEGDQ
jgi:hypothetical protein